MSGTPNQQLDAPGDIPPPAPSEFVQSIPKEQPNLPIQSTSAATIYEQTRSSLPSANELSKFPNEIQRIIVIEWVENRKHRTASEEREQKYGLIERIIGMLFGFLLAITLIVGSIHIILSGYSAEGLIGIGWTVATVAGVFVYTDKRKR